MVWYLAMRWRRRWRGAVAVGLGVLGLAVVGATLHAADRQMQGALRSTVVGLIFWPYVGVVLAVGAFIVLLPRRTYASGRCWTCGYDLEGLSPEDLRCPECGTPVEYRCGGCYYRLDGLEPAGLRCPNCGQSYRGPGSLPAVSVAPATSLPPAAPAATAPARAPTAAP